GAGVAHDAGGATRVGEVEFVLEEARGQSLGGEFVEPPLGLAVLSVRELPLREFEHRVRLPVRFPEAGLEVANRMHLGEVRERAELVLCRVQRVVGDEESEPDTPGVLHFPGAELLVHKSPFCRIGGTNVLPGCATARPLAGRAPIVQTRSSSTGLGSTAGRLGKAEAKRPPRRRTQCRGSRDERPREPAASNRKTRFRLTPKA